MHLLKNLLRSKMKAKLKLLLNFSSFVTNYLMISFNRLLLIPFMDTLLFLMTNSLTRNSYEARESGTLLHISQQQKNAQYDVMRAFSFLLLIVTMLHSLLTVLFVEQSIRLQEQSHRRLARGFLYLLQVLIKMAAPLLNALLSASPDLCRASLLLLIGAWLALKLLDTFLNLPFVNQRAVLSQLYSLSIVCIIFVLKLAQMQSYARITDELFFVLVAVAAPLSCRLIGVLWARRLRRVMEYHAFQHGRECIEPKKLLYNLAYLCSCWGSAGSDQRLNLHIYAHLLDHKNMCGFPQCFCKNMEAADGFSAELLFHINEEFFQKYLLAQGEVMMNHLKTLRGFEEQMYFLRYIDIVLASNMKMRAVKRLTDVYYSEGKYMLNLYVRLTIQMLLKKLKLELKSEQQQQSQPLRGGPAGKLSRNFDCEKQLNRFIRYERLKADVKSRLRQIYEDKLKFLSSLLMEDAKVFPRWVELARLCYGVQRELGEFVRAYPTPQAKSLVLFFESEIFHNYILSSHISQSLSTNFSQFSSKSPFLKAMNIYNQQQVVSITVSYGKKKGKILSYSQKFPEFAGYQKIQFDYVGQIRELIPHILADSHENLIKEFLRTGQSRFFKMTAPSFLQLKNYFIKPVVMFYDINFQDIKDFTFYLFFKDNLAAIKNIHIMATTDGAIKGVSENFMQAFAYAPEQLFDIYTTNLFQYIPDLYTKIEQMEKLQQRRLQVETIDFYTPYNPGLNKTLHQLSISHKSQPSESSIQYNAMRSKSQSYYSRQSFLSLEPKNRDEYKVTAVIHIRELKTKQDEAISYFQVELVEPKKKSRVERNYSLLKQHILEGRLKGLRDKIWQIKRSSQDAGARKHPSIADPQSLAADPQSLTADRQSLAADRQSLTAAEGTLSEKQQPGSPGKQQQGAQKPAGSLRNIEESPQSASSIPSSSNRCSAVQLRSSKAIDQAFQTIEIVQSEKDVIDVSPLVLKLQTSENVMKDTFFSSGLIQDYPVMTPPMVYASGMPGAGLRLRQQDEAEQLGDAGAGSPHYLDETQVQSLGFMDHYKLVESFHQKKEEVALQQSEHKRRSQQLIDLQSSLPAYDLRRKNSIPKRSRRAPDKFTHFVQNISKEPTIEQEQSIPSVQVLRKEKSANDFNLYVNESRQQDASQLLVEENAHYLIMQRKMSQQIFFSKQKMSDKGSEDEEEEEDALDHSREDDDIEKYMEKHEMTHYDRNMQSGINFISQLEKQFKASNSNSQGDRRSVRRMKSSRTNYERESSQSQNLIQHQSRDKFLHRNLVVKSQKYSRNMIVMLSLLTAKTGAVLVVMLLFLVGYRAQLQSSKNILEILNFKPRLLYGVCEIANLFEQRLYLLDKGVDAQPAADAGPPAAQINVTQFAARFLEEQMAQIYGKVINQTMLIKQKPEFSNFYTNRWHQLSLIDRQRSRLYAQTILENDALYYLRYNLYKIHQLYLTTQNRSLSSSVQAHREFLAVNYLSYYDITDAIHSNAMDYGQDSLEKQFYAISFIALVLLLAYLIFVGMSVVYWKRFNQEIIGCYNLWEATDRVWVSKLLEKGNYIYNLMEQNIDTIQCYKFNYCSVQKNLEWEEKQREYIYREFRKTGKNHIIHLPAPSSPIIWHLKLDAALQCATLVIVLTIFVNALLYQLDYNKTITLYSEYSSISQKVSELLFLKNQIYNHNDGRLALMTEDYRDQLLQRFDQKLLALSHFYQRYLIQYDQMTYLNQDFKDLIKEINRAKLCDRYLRAFGPEEQFCQLIIGSALNNGLVSVISFFITEFKTEREMNFTNKASFAINIDQGKVEAIVYLNRLNDFMIENYHQHLANRVNQLISVNTALSVFAIVFLLAFLLLASHLVFSKLLTQNIMARQSIFLVPPYSLYKDTRFITKLQLYLTQGRFNRM